MANMNERDIPSVPITTLAGVASLTGLLPEMPLPTPLAQTLSTKSLLFHPRVAEEALNLLDVRGESLVPGLVQSLGQTSADHIDLKDNYSDAQYLSNQCNTNNPQLLQSILEKNPNTFDNGNISAHTSNHIPCGSNQVWNHNSLSPSCTNLGRGGTAMTKYGQISPCGSRQIPQGSPAAPASATLPFLPPPVTNLTNHIQFNQHDPNKEMISNNTNELDNMFNDRQNVVNMYSNVNGIYVDNMSNMNINNMNSNAHGSPHAILRENEQDNKYVLQRNASNYIGNEQLAGRFPNIRGPSPAQASDAPMSTGMYSVIPFEVKSTENPQQENIFKDPLLSNVALPNEVIASNVENCNIVQAPLYSNSTEPQESTNPTSFPYTAAAPVVVINRLAEKDQAAMQKSLSSFAKVQPELAKELGINHTVENQAKDQPKNDSDPEYTPEEPNDKFSALQRKRTYNKIQETTVEIPIVKPKLRKIERKFVPVVRKLTEEELMKTNTYIQFLKEINKVLENIEDYTTEYDELSSDLFISQYQLNILSREAAQLKEMGAMSSVPGQKLARLLEVLSYNIKGGLNVLPLADPDEDDDSSEIWLNTAMERVMGAVESSLITMYIMTSKEMPKNVYIEDIIDHIVQFVQYQLQNTIYPTLDSTHRIDMGKQKGVDKRKKQTHTTSAQQRKNITLFYNKLNGVVRLLTELLCLQSLTDTTVLHLSSMSVSPFFVENVNELQLESLKLVTTIFTKYEMHRKLLLNDILASMARLPSTKRNLRSYKLDTNVYIQMLTALVLQLIQCVVVLPDRLMDTTTETKTQNALQNSELNNKKLPLDKDIFVQQKYDSAVSIGGMFLDTFLNKCRNRSEETDFRPMFENFVHDLLLTVNKPQWPAAELLLSLLGTMLTKYISNKSMDVGIRVTSLEYLGLVAARLRKDSVHSSCKVDTMDKMIADIKAEEQKEGDCEQVDTESNVVLNDEEERAQYLQSVLLDFLAVNAQEDISWTHARHFYLCQWYKDNISEKNRIAAGGAHKMHSKRLSKKKKSHGRDDGDTSDDDTYSDADDKDRMIRSSDQQLNSEVYTRIEHRKRFLLSKIKPFHDKFSGGTRVQIFKTYINYSNAELIAQYLASNRPFSKSFDTFLKNMVLVLCETSIAIRTKVMKCMSMIVEVDSKVLARSDMACSVKNSLLDPAASVREAAADLLGKFMLGQPDIIDQYYDRLTGRILDTSVSVRKRVIKILRDICIELPTYEKIPEICIKMIKRVNDEEGIRKLVVDVFQEMWFKPVHSSQEAEILTRRVSNITAVVMELKDNNNNEWFEQLLLNLFKPKEDKEDSTKIHVEPPKILITACTQIVEYLIKTIISLDNSIEDGNELSHRNSKLAACMSTLNLFAKIRPQMLIEHVLTLEPYMITKCQTPNDIQIASAVASIMELTVPLMEHPSETFLARVEENAIKLIMFNSTPNIVINCFSCLGATVNNVTHNYRLIRDFFVRCFNQLRFIKSNSNIETGLYKSDKPNFRPNLRRILFIIGLMLRHFDFGDPIVIDGLDSDIKNQVFETLLFFIQINDRDLQLHTLRAIGSVCVRHYDLMLESELKSFYHRMLLSSDSPTNMRIEVLKNIETYLQEEEKRMIKLNSEWHKRGKQEDLKEMCDVSSGMASTVIQDYLNQILASSLTDNVQIRMASIQVIKLVLHQGLVCPLMIVPYLICLSTDTEKMVCHTSDNQLQDIHKKYPGFVHMKANAGINLSYDLQSIIQKNSDDQIVRGYRNTAVKGEPPVALNGFLYTLLRSTKPQRRGVLMSILKQFEEKDKSLSNMLYLADNLACFPYQVQDEPLYVIHQIDINVSLNGTTLLNSFQDALKPHHAISSDGLSEIPTALPDEDEDDDNADDLLQRMPEDTTHLQNLITAAQGCLLLLFLKEHLKTIYGFSDSKLVQYSPSEASKMYEKNVTRRSASKFNPTSTIKKLKEGVSSKALSPEARRQLIDEYLYFKQKMLRLDPDDKDSEEEENRLNGLNSTVVDSHSRVAVESGSATTVPNLGNTVIPNENTVVPQNIDETTDPLGQDISPNKKVQKVPPLRITTSRKNNTKVKTAARSHKHVDKQKKHRQKKKRKKYIRSSEDESDSSSDSDYYA